jgi:uncharacterized protein DUF6627
VIIDRRCRHGIEPWECTGSSGILLRDRVLRIRWLRYLIVAGGVAWAAAPRLAEAAPLPPARTEAAAAGDLDSVWTALEEKIVRERLLELGLSPAEAATVLDRLTPTERSELVARAQELGAGGSAAAGLAVAIIVALLVILVLELMGRRVISRP